jgi:hypothetical protein
MSHRARFSVPVIFLIAAMLFLWPIAFHPGDIPIRSGAKTDLLSHLPGAVHIREIYPGRLITLKGLPLLRVIWRWAK